MASADHRIDMQLPISLGQNFSSASGCRCKRFVYRLLRSKWSVLEMQLFGKSRPFPISLSLNFSCCHLKSSKDLLCFILSRIKVLIIQAVGHPSCWSSKIHLVPFMFSCTYYVCKFAIWQFQRVFHPPHFSNHHRILARNWICGDLPMSVEFD